MITAALTFVFVWCLFYERMPQSFLLLLCAGLGIFFAVARRHKQALLLSNDGLAQVSRLKKVNPSLKFWTLFALMLISVASQNPYTGALLTAAMFFIAVCVSGARVRQYVQVMVLPILFLLIGGLALLFEVSPGPTGVINFSLFGFWLSVSEATQLKTALVVSRAFGAVSCLCVLSVTTPMPDIIGVLRRARCPDIIIDLMYLIYRYIFIMLALHHEMRNAAKSRLGFRDYRTSLRATGKIYAQLLARSYQCADRNFDAMESRCYDTGITFLSHRNKVTFVHGFVAALLLSVFLCLALLL